MRNLFAIICSVLLCGCVAGQPDPQGLDPLQLPVIGGTLPQDLQLDGNYLLSADLQVPVGLTLTIKPGTTIYIQPSDSTKIDPEFLSREVEVLVRGSLQAVGTSEKPIVFKPVSDDPRAILWSGLQLIDTEQVHLAHVVIEQAEAGVLCMNASPQIRYLQVRRSRYGVLLQQQSKPLIRDSLITDGEAGFFCWDQSAPQVSGSRIIDQQEEGLYIGRECQGVFSSNLIKGNDRGVVLPDGVAFASSNRLIDNRQTFQHYPGGQE